jgi:hypothetical protein
MKSQVLTFAALVGALALPAAPSSALAATPAPAWRVESIANPQNFELLVSNVGDAHSTEEAVTVTDTLPPGVGTSGQSGDLEAFWACSSTVAAGHTVVTCTISGELLRLLRPGISGTLAQLPALPVYVSESVPANSTLINTVKVEGGGAATVEQKTPMLLNPSSPLSFGLADFGSYLAEASGVPDTQAAGHPNSLTTSFDVNRAVNRAGGTQVTPTRSVQDVKDIVVDLPTGFVGDPQAAQQCPLHDLVTLTTSSGCPGASQVGRVSFNGSGAYQGEYYKDGRQNIPVYNMVAEHGYPAEFGFVYAGVPLVMYASVVGKEAATHVRVSIPGVPASQLVSLEGAEVTFFGDPTLQDGLPFSPVAFFTNPSDCSGKPLVTSIHVDSWQEQGARNADGTPNFSDPAWKSDTAETPAMEGCGALHFNPTISLTPDLPQAGAPTGLGVNLEVPQTSDPSIPATPDVKQVVVKLPAGMVVSPSAANGLGACSPAQIALENNDTPTCPESSKIATVRVKTPLLAEELEGSVYLAQQGNAGPAQGSNPFNSLLAGYIVVEGSGVLVKIPGKIEADEHTGQLTATFAESPQLPFSDFKLHFKSGPRAPLANPPACGTYTPEATLSSWSGHTVQSERPFAITQGENGGACPSGSTFSPSFSAGTSNNQAAAFSPFTLTFSRSDQDQTLGGITVQMPTGLLGRIAGIPQCPEAQANAGTCGAESLIGHTTVGAGPGADPFYVGGNVYLTQGYKGTPFGLSIVVPVVAGPFNLGTEVVRAAIAVNPNTAQITVTSNPLPTIKEGIPFQVRTVNVTIDRPGFTFNPTNCAAQSVGATITSTAGASATVSSPFEAANCATLPFKPQFSASTSGKTSKALGASLTVKIGYTGGQANLHKVNVELPKALPTQLKTLNKACTEAQFNANPAGCPPASDVAQVTVHTPLLNSPLTGPAYLVSHGGAAFPDVEMVLQGEGVELVVDGKTQIKKGITYSHFETVPDAPFTSFEFNSPQGELALFTAEGDLCDQKLVMPATLTGQNGAVLKQNTPIEVTGCSSSLAVVSSKIKRKTLTLSVYAPGAGKVTAGGKGVSSGSKTYSGREALTFTLKQKKAGKLKTKIKLTYTPSKGKKQTKEVRASFRS